MHAVGDSKALVWLLLLQQGTSKNKSIKNVKM